MTGSATQRRRLRAGAAVAPRRFCFAMRARTQHADDAQPQPKGRRKRPRGRVDGADVRPESLGSAEHEPTPCSSGP